MTVRDLLFFCGGVLAALALAGLVRALRHAAARGAAALSRLTMVGALIAVVLIGVGLASYVRFGAPSAMPAAATTAGEALESSPHASISDSGAPGSLEEAAARLAARLAREGGSDADWELLAKTYDALGRSADAARAREHHVNAPGPSRAAQASAGAGSATSARIAGTVSIAPQLLARVPRSATLFIYARAADDAGPPLAVLREAVDRWPVEFLLDDANAMIAGRTLSGANAVELEARISLTGDALPHSGDLIGTLAAVDPHGQQPVRIRIDRPIG